MASIEELLKSKTYLDKSIDFLHSVYIYEFDIRAANINSLKTAGRISDNLYNMLLHFPKNEREIYIGNLIKSDKSYQQDIDQIIHDSKNILLTDFIKDPNSVLRIANDAIFFINPLPDLPMEYRLKGKYSNIVFVQKNKFNAFLKFDNILVFINTNSPEFVVDVKGINDSAVPLHEPILELICNCISAKETGGVNTSLRIFNDYYSKYISLKLPIEYYREFNSNSGYRINSSVDTFITPEVPPEIDIRNLDINTNLKVLRILYSYLLR